MTGKQKEKNNIVPYTRMPLTALETDSWLFFSIIQVNVFQSFEEAASISQP